MRAPDAPIAGIRSGQVTGRTWDEKGRTPIVRCTGNRFSVNAMSAVGTGGRMHFMAFTGTFDAAVMCRFLDRIAFRPSSAPDSREGCSESLRIRRAASDRSR